MIKIARLTFLMSVSVFLCSMQAQEQMILSSVLYRHFEEQGVGLQELWNGCWTGDSEQELEENRNFFWQRLGRVLCAHLSIEDIKGLMIPVQRRDVSQCKFCVSSDFPSSPASKENLSRLVITSFESYFLSRQSALKNDYALPQFAIILTPESLVSRAKNIFKTNIVPAIGRLARNRGAQLVAAGVLAGAAAAIACQADDDEMCTDDDVCDSEKNEDFYNLINYLVCPFTGNACGPSVCPDLERLSGMPPEVQVLFQRMLDLPDPITPDIMPTVIQLQHDFCRALASEQEVAEFFTQCPISCRDYY